MDSITCKNCEYVIDTKIYSAPQYCPKCGNKVEYYKVNFCPHCCPDGPESGLDEMANDDKYCHVCGNKTVLYDYIVEQEN